MNTERQGQLQQAFEYADNFVLLNTQCPTLAEISNGWCDIWARAVKRMAKFVEIRESHGHYFVVYDGVGYDSDCREGFEPF